MTTMYTGRDVIDQNGQTVGTVSDVFFDNTLNEPKWLVVNPGLLRKERLVPLDGAYEAGDDTLVTPFTKEWIKQAPSVAGNHYPDPAALQDASEHFGVDP